MIRKTPLVDAVVVTFFVACVAFTGGCGLIDNTADCSTVCESYATCFDDDYDVESCRDRCVDKSWGSEEYTAQVNACDACIAGQDCVDNVFECGSDCADIIDE